jgi:hypothetical protein
MTSTRSRPSSRLLLVLAAVAVSLFGLVAPASAAGPYCGITWGSVTNAVGETSQPGVALTGVRTGRHGCYDRLVVDLNQLRGFGGYMVEYSTLENGAGIIPLRGAADLRIVVHAPARDEWGNATYQPSHPLNAVPVSGYRTFRQVAWTGSFEGNSVLGLGVRARLPFRVFTLDGPGSGGRLVIDVAHHW